MGTWKSADGSRRKFTKEDREEARASLLQDVKPGDTLFTVLRHRSNSGMFRRISVVKPTIYLNHRGSPRPDFYHLDYNIGALLDWSTDGNGEGVHVGGCGMDMGFHLVYTLARVIFQDGFGC